MKNYGYILIFFCLNSSICVPSAGGGAQSTPLLTSTRFIASCSKRDNLSQQEVSSDYNFLQIPIIKNILKAAITGRNNTIITITSNNEPHLRLLRIQLTDPEDNTTLLIKYQLYHDRSSQNETHEESIWPIISSLPNNNIGVTDQTAGELTEIFIDTPHDCKTRFTNIIHCKTSDRIDFYPSYLIKRIAEHANKDNKTLSQYKYLDPRALLSIQRYIDKQNSARP